MRLKTNLYIKCDSQLITRRSTRSDFLNHMYDDGPEMTDDGTIIYKTRDIIQYINRPYKIFYYSKSNVDITGFISGYRTIGMKECEEITKKIMYETDFMLIIHDENINKLFVMRSPNGVVPLYYYFDNNQLILSMHVHSIAKSLRKSISDFAITQLLSMNYLMEPYTFYDEVLEVRRNYIYEFDINLSSVETLKFYDLKYNNNSELALESHVDRLNESIIQAHNRRLSARNNGLFLSGGLDSVVISYALKNLISDSQVHSFNVSVEGQQNSEAEYARFAADHFGLTHNELVISPKVLADSILEKIVHSNFPYWGVLYIGGILDEYKLEDYNLFTGQDTRLHTPYFNSVDHFVYLLNKDRQIYKLGRAAGSLISKKSVDVTIGKVNKIFDRLQYLNDIEQYIIKFQFHCNILDEEFNERVFSEVNKITDKIRNGKTYSYHDFFNDVVWLRWGQQYTDDIKYMDSLCNLYQNVCQFPFYDLLLAEVSASIPFEFSNKLHVGRSSFGNKINLNKKYMLKKLLEKNNIPDYLSKRNKAVSSTIHLFFNSNLKEMVKNQLASTQLKEYSAVQNMDLDEMIDRFITEERLYATSDYEYLIKIYNLFMLDTLIRYIS